MDLRMPLACLLIAGGAVGFALPLIRPGALPDSSQASGATSSVGTARLDMVIDNPGWGDDVVLRRESDGHFYADVSVDGRSYRMLVDTGASVVALTEGDALDMGLNWDEQDVAPVAQGAGGAVSGVNTTIDRISVGGNEASGVRAVIIPDGLGISLLGQSYLSTLRKVEIAGDRMILGS